MRAINVLKHYNIGKIVSIKLCLRSCFSPNTASNVLEEKKETISSLSSYEQDCLGSRISIASLATQTSQPHASSCHKHQKIKIDKTRGRIASFNVNLPAACGLIRKLVSYLWQWTPMFGAISKRELSEGQHLLYSSHSNVAKAL